MADSVKTILTNLKLKKLNSATLLKYNQTNYNQLNLIDSYVTWGYTNKKTIDLLVRKRGVVMDGDSKNVRELENSVIETNLGKLNILCIEDLIHELFTSGKNFDVVMNFLGFFLLSPCEELQESTVVPFYKGGCSGFRGNEINKLLMKML